MRWEERVKETDRLEVEPGVRLGVQLWDWL